MAKMLPAAGPDRQHRQRTAGCRSGYPHLRQPYLGPERDHSLSGRRNAILRPLNYPPGVPGRGCLTLDHIAVVNLIGRTFINNYDCPFRAMDTLLPGLRNNCSVIIVDFHAEAPRKK